MGSAGLHKSLQSKEEVIFFIFKNKKVNLENGKDVKYDIESNLVVSHPSLATIDI